MFYIENTFLKVEIDKKGAQLTSIQNKNAAIDYIWKGKEWPKHAPILFPAIGRSTNDQYLINKTFYPMQQHGFANDCLFDRIEQTPTKIVLRFTENKETLKSYPFQFQFIVTYELIDHQLMISFCVKNTGGQKMTYSLGFHPAFNVPIAAEGTFEDYQLDFKTKDHTLERFEIIKSPYPYRTGKKIRLDEGVKSFPLTRKLFKDGLIILNNRMDSVTLKSTKTAHQINMDCSDFPYFCLWTKEDEALDFLCLEPFYGLPDIIGQTQELYQKEGNIELEAGSEKTLHCSMTLI